MSGRFDVAVVGGGIVGLALARELLRRRPGHRLVLLEKEGAEGMHQTSHNSGVIHSGVYYAPGSRKARLCVEGRKLLLDYCGEQGIPHAVTGKVIVAATPEEIPRLHLLRERGIANGLQGLELLGPEELREREPDVSGLAALMVAETGLVDFSQVAARLAADVSAAEGTILYRHGVAGVREEAGSLRLATAQGEISAGFLLSCGGLQSDRIAAMTERGLDVRILPFRGRWSILRPEARHGPRRTIYPVPDPRYPFLGVHFTRRMDGSVWVGPNATLAMSREDYGRGPRSLGDLAATLAWPGFWRMAARNWRHGAFELWKDRVAAASLAAARQYIPGLERGDLLPGPSGIRAQAVGRDGRLADDFEFREGRRALHVVNAPSPAATASLAIAREIADRAESPFREAGL